MNVSLSYYCLICYKAFKINVKQIGKSINDKIGYVNINYKGFKLEISSKLLELNYKELTLPPDIRNLYIL